MFQALPTEPHLLKLQPRGGKPEGVPVGTKATCHGGSHRLLSLLGDSRLGFFPFPKVLKLEGEGQSLFGKRAGAWRNGLNSTAPGLVSWNRMGRGALGHTHSH